MPMPLNRSSDVSINAIKRANAQLRQSARELREHNAPELADWMEKSADQLAAQLEAQPSNPDQPPTSTPIRKTSLPPRKPAAPTPAAPPPAPAVKPPEPLTVTPKPPPAGI